MPSRHPLALLLTLGAIASTGLPAVAQAPPPTTTAPAAAPATEPSAKEAVQDAAKAEPAKPKTDPIERIKDEALNRSQVMATLSYLTDVIGPRLTASPAMKRANDWTRDKLAGWGLANAHLEPWGPFGKGWTLQRFSIQVVEPHCIPLIAFPKAWSPGTNGTVTGEVVDLDAAKTDADLEKFKGKLNGAFILVGPPLDVEAHFGALGSRLNDKELLELANAAAPAGRRRPQMTPERRARILFQRKKMTFAMEEGASAVLDGSSNGEGKSLGDGGTLFVAQATVPTAPLPPAGDFDPTARRVSAWDKDAPRFLPQITVASEQYNRLVRMVRQGEKLKVALDLAVQFHDDPPAFNTVAEIPGTDLKDEVVMLGGHMDSWHSGTGATDNAAGVSAAMEVVRVLKALDLKPRRTIRVALWSGEEQGLFGSRAYVKEHFGQLGDGTGMGGGGGNGSGAGNGGPPGGNRPPAKLTTKPEYDKFSAYFNLDNGTGKIRGIYLQGNEAARTVFRPWLAPFKDLGASTITLSNTGGTDHQSFDGIGLPGFQFIQDIVEYDTRTHHSNQDLYDRVQPDDMKQAAAIMAAFVFNTANRDEKLPRKPAPGTPEAAPTSPTPAPAPPVTTTTTSAAGN